MYYILSWKYFITFIIEITPLKSVRFQLLRAATANRKSCIYFDRKQLKFVVLYEIVNKPLTRVPLQMFFIKIKHPHKIKYLFLWLTNLQCIPRLTLLKCVA